MRICLDYVYAKGVKMRLSLLKEDSLYDFGLALLLLLLYTTVLSASIIAMPAIPMNNNPRDPNYD